MGGDDCLRLHWSARSWTIKFPSDPVSTKVVISTPVESLNLYLLNLDWGGVFVCSGKMRMVGQLYDGGQ